MTTATAASDVQALLDRAAIQDLLTQYFVGLDRSDPELVRRCFSDDAVAWYDGRSPMRSAVTEGVRGPQAIVDSLITFQRKKAGAWKVTTHFMGAVHYLRLGADTAETETYAVAFIVLPGPPDQVAMRSLRYLDRLCRTPAGWRIAERQHTLDWSCQVPADFAVDMGQRLLARRGG